MTVKEFKLLLSDKPDNLEVFFRRVAPICGNIKSVGKVEQTTFSTFGIEIPCIIIEPYPDEVGADGN